MTWQRQTLREAKSSHRVMRIHQRGQSPRWRVRQTQREVEGKLFSPMDLGFGRLSGFLSECRESQKTSGEGGPFDGSRVRSARLVPVVRWASCHHTVVSQREFFQVATMVALGTR